MNENILLVLSIVALIAVGGLAFKVLTEPPKKETNGGSKWKID